jgi:hypothetical protein
MAMVRLKRLGLFLLMATLVASTPLRADNPPAAPAANEITAFEVPAADRAKLDWLQRWSAKLPDPFERFAALSFAWSASEQLAIAEASNEGPLQRRPKFRPYPGFDAKPGHLAEVRLLAELRLRGPPSSAPGWQARHLCNAVRLSRDWLLSSAGCVTLEAELAGLEAVVGAADLAADDARALLVERIVRQPDGPLVLLHLGGAGGLPEPELYWLGPRLPQDARLHLLSWGRPMPLPGLPATLFRYTEFDLHPDFSCNGPPEQCFIPNGVDVCDAAAAAWGYRCLVQAGVRLCPGDEGSPVYFVGEDGTVSLYGMTVLREQQCFISTTRQLRPVPVLELSRHRAWIEATIAPADGEG